MLAKRVTIIGTGMMGGALLKGLATSGAGDYKITAVDLDPAKLERLKEEYGVGTSTSAKSGVADADLVVLAVKPWIVSQIAKEIGPSWPDGAILISVAAGVRTGHLERFLPFATPVVRAMPNTPALIGAGVTAIAAGSAAGEEHMELAKGIMGQLGPVVTVTETSLDAVTGLSGSGPAYVYLFIEALIDAGVREGLSRDIARQLAVETVIGSARMVKESGEHPAKLKDAVTTPGGTTIAALASLEGGSLRGLIFEAVHKATETSRLLGKGD